MSLFFLFFTKFYKTQKLFALKFIHIWNIFSLSQVQFPVNGNNNRFLSSSSLLAFKNMCLHVREKMKIHFHSPKAASATCFVVWRFLLSHSLFTPIDFVKKLRQIPHSWAYFPTAHNKEFSHDFGSSDTSRYKF